MVLHTYVVAGRWIMAHTVSNTQHQFSVLEFHIASWNPNSCLKSSSNFLQVLFHVILVFLPTLQGLDILDEELAAIELDAKTAIKG